jgi:hypothetical protein
MRGERAKDVWLRLGIGRLGKVGRLVRWEGLGRLG